MVESLKFLRTANPKIDESFMGYILRLTELNGYESPEWIMRLIGVNYNLTSRSCSSISESSESLKLLANLCGIRTSELAQLTYHRVSEYSYSHRSFFGAAVDEFCIRTAHPKICAKCLLETAYCHRTWELALITACPIHECMLLDECPSCKQRITWARSSLTSCLCKFDWRESSVTPVKEPELKLARIIYYLCGLPYSKDTSLLLQQNLVLRLSLEDFIFAIVFMAGQLQGLSIITGKNLLPSGRIKDIHNLFTQAYYIFEDWPNYFYLFLRWWGEQERNNALNNQRIKSPLYRDFGKLYVGLYKILWNRQFDFIRDAFVDYLIEEWDGVDTLPFKKTVKESHIPGRYVSKGDARRILEIDDARINQLIETGELKTVVRSKGMKRLIFVEMSGLAKLTHEKDMKTN